MKISLKIKVFTWYLCRVVILTKDNLVKRNWYESMNFLFCPQQETIKHLFFECSFARSIWSSIQIASNYINQSLLQMFLATGCMGLIKSIKVLLGWER